MSANDRALVVYESMFGNTERIAEAVAEGLRSGLAAEVVRADRAPLRLPEVGLVVVGGPTHAFGMSRANTRVIASVQGPTVMPVETGIRDWLEQLPYQAGAPMGATFDTRASKGRRLPGSAARSAAKVLHKRGFKTPTEPVSFFVIDTVGPLAGGELVRARNWGEKLANVWSGRPERSPSRVWIAARVTKLHGGGPLVDRPHYGGSRRSAGTAHG